MSEEAPIAILGLALSIISVIPIAAGVYFWLLRYSVAHRFLRFTVRGPIDFVLTTSAMHVSPRHLGAKIRRPVTGIGQIQGTALASKAIGDFYRRKPIRVHLSVDVQNALDEDLLIIGGPAKNAIARQYFNALPASASGDRTVFDDIQGIIAVPSRNKPGLAINVAMNLDDIHFVPTEDWGLVVLSRNPFSSNSRRAVFISGFTSYGTAATAGYLFGTVMRRSWRFIHSARISRRSKKSGLFGFIVRITFSSGHAIAFSDLKWFDYPVD